VSIRTSRQWRFPQRRALACAGWVLASVTAAAQTQPIGQLAGVVRDNTGSVLPGASVTLTGAALIAPRTVITDERGKYQLEKLARGRYSVAAALRGFQPWSMDVDLDGGSLTLDVVLLVPSFSERVTVSATKTGATDIQSIPLSITAIPARTLEQLGVQTVEGLAGFVPTLTVSQHTGIAQITIRGIGTNSAIPGSDPSSTTHLDGVYLARPAMGFMDFLNVERLEVLRGPQGTLYGRNSVGGTINIVTRQPTNALEASTRLTAGSYDKLRAEGAVSGPLIKNKVMANFAFVRGTREGLVRDLDHPEHSLGSEDTWAGRGQLRLVLGSRSELLLSGDHERYEGIPLTYAKPIAAKSDYPFASPASLWEVRASHLASGKNIQQGGSARLTLQLNSTTSLNSLTAYRRSDYHVFFDADATELTLQTSNVPELQRQASHELTLVRRTPKLTWIGGAFLFEEHTSARVEITVYPAIQIRPFSKMRTEARALFGQATYDLSSRVSLTTGIRYTDEQKDVDNVGGTYLIGTNSLANPGSFYEYVDTVTFDAWTPKVGIQAQASPDTLVYVSAARGFKSGGFNPAAPRPGLPFGPEFAWNYEGGLKRSMAGGRVRANMAVFYTDYRDLQVQSFIRPGVPDIRNAASAIIKGVEVEVAAAARSGPRFSGHFAWLDASYDRFLAVLPGGATRLVAGNRLYNAPEWSGSGFAVYEFAAGRAGTASVRGDLSWQSRVFFTPVNDAIETQQAHGLVHLRAGFEPPGRRWEIAVYVRNAGNREYVTGTGNAGLAAYTARPGEPRLWGTQFSVRR
jgi:iron complex outermembrane receptor protein